MKNLARLFFLFVFLFFLPQRVEAAISSINATAVITSCPQLLSGSDRCEADLYAQTTDGSTETFNATYGIDFRTGSPPGVTTYLWNASPYNTGTITVGPTSEYVGSFYTMVNNGTGTCALNEGQVHARPRIDQVCTLCFTPDSYGIRNIGAMVHIDVYNSDGSDANGASVSISPSDGSAGSGTTSGGRVTFTRINCTVGHSVSASLGGQDGSLWLPAQPGGGSSGPCNGTARAFSITLSAPVPPPGNFDMATSGECHAGGGADVNLSWESSSDASYYDVAWASGSGDPQGSVQLNNYAQTSYASNTGGFTRGATYSFWVGAQNSSGTTWAQNGWHTITMPTEAECAPAATNTPTPPPASTCVGAGRTCGTSSSPATGSSCTTSGGASGTWQWDGQPSSQVVLQIRIYIVITALHQRLHHLLQSIHFVQISILTVGQMHV